MELMTVVGIVGILAAVAIPSFVRYQLRSKRSEAMVNMGAIRSAQESFAGSYDSYANVTAAAPQLALHSDKVSWPSRPCPAACRRGATVSCTEFSCIGYAPTGATYFNYRSPHEIPAGAPPEFCIEAAADLDGDGVPGTFEFQTDNADDGDGNTVACSFSDSGSCAPSSDSPFQINECQVGAY